MPRIASRLDPRSPAFEENAAHHRALAADLRAQVAKVSEGGGPDAQKKHAARGKLEKQIPQLPPRDRIDAGGRLVEKNDLRFMNQRARQRQPLLPSAGQC